MTFEIKIEEYIEVKSYFILVLHHFEVKYEIIH